MIDNVKIQAAIAALDARRHAIRTGRAALRRRPNIGLVTPPLSPLSPVGFIVRPLASLRETAKQRAPGYLEVCLAAGKPDATGQYVTFTREAFLRIRQQFSLKASVKIIKPCCQ